MTNTTIDPRFIAEARELLAADYEWRDWLSDAQNCRDRRYDDTPKITVLARVLQERPIYTREQELEAMEAAITDVFNKRCTAEQLLDVYKRHLTAPPKVDPLVEALAPLTSAGSIKWEDVAAEEVRRLLAARGLKIVEAEG